jgi:hypothetical protein
MRQQALLWVGTGRSYTITEKTFAEKKLSKPVRVYMTVGDVERGRPTFEKMAAYFKSRNYPNVSLQSKVLENTGHSGT